MVESTGLPDAMARDAAETTFDRNVVVLAGAGTGKTTLLVNRLLHALLRDPQPIRLVNVLALTFTNKAAQEMKLRLRDRLQGLLGECDGARASGLSGRWTLPEFRDRYRLSTETVRTRVAQALEDLERSHIRTLHSFAASVLRLYPFEAQVPPNFREDTGVHFDEIFEQIWESWIEQELGPTGQAHGRWESVLQAIPIQEVRFLASMIAREECALTELRPSVVERDSLQQGRFRQWLIRKAQEAEGLLQTYGRPNPRKIERQVEEARRVFERILRDGLSDGDGGNPEEDGWDGLMGSAPRDWDPGDFQRAKQMILSAQSLGKINHPLLELLLDLLTPCIERVRQLYREQGWIGFDGLLVKVRNLLREYPVVREQMKREYQAILIDEFQDTDPVQYEILLFLAECHGQQVPSWADVQVVPGKLFIVGDPKQSIYAFRRADIAAFDQVVAALIKGGALVCTLTTNFRSHGNILQVVNAVFEELFIQKNQVQPPHIPLEVGRESAGLSRAGVELYVLAQPESEQEWDAERATRAEAEWLGDWMQRLLSQGSQEGAGSPRNASVRPGDIAVLFRKLTNAQWYVEALRRRGIPYVTDGERHFYQRQEVIDVVNVLRLIDDPADGIALVGVLRSSLGGVPDTDIMALAQCGPLDVSHPCWLQDWESGSRRAVQALCERLVSLHRVSRHLSLSHLLDRLFEELPLVELAAASSHGEQAVVNIWKLRDLMVEMSRGGAVSFSGLVARLVGNIRTPPQEAEAPLAEDSLDAVRVLTIHKAKGLEFPVVVLPGLHAKTGGSERGASLTRDWVSGMYGVTFARWCNASQVPLWEKQREQEEAEQRRLLYVGMTRAKERLVLSGGALSRAGGGAPFQLLRGLIGEDFGNPVCTRVQVGEIGFPHIVVTSPFKRTKAAHDGTTPLDAPSMPDFSQAQWTTRNRRWQQAQQAMVWTTPSSDPMRSARGASVWKRESDVQLGMPGPQLGTLVHQFLEYCSFSADAAVFQKSVEDFCLVQTSIGTTSPILLAELRAMLHSFPQTRIYQELRSARILGREVPVTVPWGIQGIGRKCPGRGILEGVLDIVYEIHGEFWVGDYKTDAFDKSRLIERMKRYESQAQRSAQAAAQSLGLDIKGCKLFFLRLDEMAVVPYIANG